jgi:hypothetical protein
VRAALSAPASSHNVSARSTCATAPQPLPEGFLKAITHTHVATQDADYLPSVPNLPQAR